MPPRSSAKSKAAAVTTKRASVTKPPTKRRKGLDVVGRGREALVRLPGLLSAMQLEKAREFFHSPEVERMLSGSLVYTHDPKDSDRASRQAWIERSAAALPEGSDEATCPLWLHAKLRAASKKVHDCFGDKACPTGVDKNGRWTPRFEPLQYTQYGTGAHYRGWHTDGEPDEKDPEDLRSVTIVVLLSDPSAYTGAHFEARFDGHSGRATRVPLPRAGDAIGFPSKYLWHRVTKCTSGMRESLVFWAKRPGVIAPRFAIDDDDEDAGAPSPDGLS